jgi:hypothetical protein
VVSRGKVVVDHGKFTGKAGSGTICEGPRAASSGECMPRSG